jgi:GxxExxY protein
MSEEQHPMNKLLNNLIIITNDIYNSIGPGYNEVIYHRAFEVGLRLNNIAYESEVVTPVIYQNHTVGHGRVDLIVKDLGTNVIIELKAIANLNNTDSIIQIKNYMKQHSIKDGLIINFGQCNKTTIGNVSIKYINNCNQIFNFTNGTFIEFTQTN